MSSRLKRKLGDIGIDPSSAKANESFCLIGTPLPPLEKSKDNGEFVPLWKQDVRDEQGRRRLHGAFTGGFSAGYFNTVGSKEGWTPQTFVSSRSARAKPAQKGARPEDFMDEEDLAELRESQIMVDLNDEMNTGIKPLVSQGDMGDDLAGRKDNFHGLGYISSTRLNDALGRDGKAAQGPKLSAGFGLGALNDADEDDLDVYDLSHSARDGGRHQAYDTNEREDDDKIVIGQSQARTHHKQKVPGQTQTFNDGRVVLDGFILSDKPVAEDKWFPIPDIPKGWKPDPKRVWERNKNKENENIASLKLPVQGPVPHRKWKKGISADERGSILGETPLPSAPRSVFEYISQKDRERIQNTAAGYSASPGSSQQLPEQQPRPRGPATITVPRIERQVATAALRGFQPFTADPVKQARYTAYLTSMANPPPEDVPGSGYVPISLIPGQSVDEFNKELEDYKKAAVIFKPISSTMANRFTSAKFVGGAGDPQGPVVEGLTVPSVESENAKRIEDAQRKEGDGAANVEDESPKAHAARMGMYGQMTREFKVWIPAKLLCKRFGVKDPNPEPISAEPSSAEPPPSGISMADPAAALVAGTESFFAPASSAQKQGERNQKDLSNIGLGEDDSQGKDTLTYQRPSRDIFKAIFASDDEDSDGEDDKKDKDKLVEPAGASVVTPEAAATPPAPTLATYQPGTSTLSSTPEKVDIAPFKPTFIPRDTTKSKSKGKKDKKKKGSERTIVSFDIDEDGGDSLLVSAPKENDNDRPKKKKKKRKDKEKEKNDTEEEGDWVEKPPPEAVKGSSPIPPDAMQTDEVPDRGRKKAIDFW